MTDIDRLIEQRDRAQRRFATLSDLRPGTVHESFTKCGKSNCRCAWDDTARHGPGHLLNSSVGGRTKSLRLRAEEVTETRRLTEEYKRFRELSVAFLKASEELAEARRQAGWADGSAGTVKKKL